MWHEQFTNKYNQIQYCFYEKYKDHISTNGNVWALF